MSNAKNTSSGKACSKGRRRGILVIPGMLAIAVLALDQLTKIIIDTSVPFGWRKAVIPGFFDLVHWRNCGAAWGIFAEHTWILGLVSLACIIAVIVFFRKLTDGKTLPALLLGLFAGGTAGNMLDRLFRSYVIDFLDVHWKEIYHYPAFNVADIAICTSIFLLVVWMLFLGDDKKKKGARPCR